MNRAILLLIGMLLACPAGAVTTGYDLLESCSEAKSDTPFESGVCTGYVRAVADVMFNYPFTGLQVCFPVDVTRDQLVGVSIRFLREHPGVLHLTAYHNVASALLLAFPCKR
jgi:phosphoglycolate phosphatase-like HAD superfamily hydrolase